MKKNVFFLEKRWQSWQIIDAHKENDFHWVFAHTASNDTVPQSQGTRLPPLQTSNTRIYTYIDSRACAYSLWCAVSLWHQQRSHLLCAAPSAIEPALSLLHVYFKGVEPFADSQCRDTGFPISSPPSTQHLGTDGFAEIIQQMDNFPLPFPFYFFPLQRKGKRKRNKTAQLYSFRMKKGEPFCYIYKQYRGFSCFCFPTQICYKIYESPQKSTSPRQINVSNPYGVKAWWLMMARLNNLDTNAILLWRDVRGSKLLPIRVRLKMLHNTLSMLHMCTI